MNKKILILFLLSFVFSFWLFSNSNKQAMAQTKIGLSVSPPISYLQVPPGTTRSHTIILENSSDSTITVTPSIVDFSSDGKTGRAVISNQLSFPYITFGTSDIKELSIPAHKKAQLTLYIDVPKDAIEREYPLTVLFFSKKDAPSTINSSFSQVTGGIGSNIVILVSKNNKINQILKILNIDTPKIIDSFGKIKFTPLVKNEEFSSATASGSAKIVNWRKNVLAEFEIYPDVILGNSSRNLRALRPGISPEKPETGSFSFKPKFLLGPYQIVINLKNNQQESLQKNNQYVEVIYAFPFSILFIIIIGTTIGLIYYKKIK